MRKGRVPVYCETPAGWCIELDVYLGEHVKSTKVKCPYCSRWTVAKGDVKNDTGSKTKTGHDKNRLPVL